MRFVFTALILLAIILPVCPSVAAQDDFSSEYIIPPNGFALINFTSTGNNLNLTIQFNSSGFLNIYLVEDQNINATSPLNYTKAFFEQSGVSSNFTEDIRVNESIPYQILVVNAGAGDVAIFVEYELSTISSGFIGPWEVLALAVIVIPMTIYAIFTRSKIHQEKKQERNLLLKLVKLGASKREAMKILKAMRKGTDNEAKMLLDEFMKTLKERSMNNIK